ncbi:ABC transporter ATP-binding protein [Armatimonas sp.]|uniref:ABC transporter ATP-binding protein n=1 Tax=Armatimonas sp. TaxID=1872638 RepID=UPI00374FED88
MPDTAGPVDDIILDIQNIHRIYDPTHALKGVSFQARRGEVIALIGPNGAGKTTIGSIMAQREKADMGKVVYYFDEGATEEPDLSQIGFFPGDSSYYMSLAVERLLYHAATRKGLTGGEAAEATQYWLDRLGMTNRPNMALSSFSKGNQQKIQFAESVLHGPSIVYLDEPFNGLDPVNQEWFIGLIRELQETGMTILISDHHMHLLERIADRFLIMHQGRLVADGTLTMLRKRAQVGLSVRLRVVDPMSVDLKPFRDHPAIRSVERTASGDIRMLISAAVPRNDVLNFIKQRMRLTEILAEPASLHDIYVTVFSVQSADTETTEVPTAVAA